MLGTEGLRRSTQVAILNANYMANKLSEEYKVLFRNENGMVAHEFIIDLKEFSDVGVNAADFTKRLQDYGFHAPTVSWPVQNSLMIEPTESENKKELDRFCEALLQIKKEIGLIRDGTYPKDNNPLKNSPHTIEMLMLDSWDKPYSKEVAFYPMEHLKTNKFWPRCGRIDEAQSDRKLYEEISNISKVSSKQ